MFAFRIIAKAFCAPQTIYECVSLVCNVQFIFGCNSLWVSRGRGLRANRWTCLYSLVLAVIVVSNLFYNIYMSVSDTEIRHRLLELDKMALSVVVGELFMALSVFSVTIFSMQHQTQRHIDFYESVDRLDRQLVSDFNVSLNYYKLKKKNAVVLLVVCVGYLVAMFLAFARVPLSNYLSLLQLSMCYIWITGGPHISGYAYMNAAEILMIRFRLLQKLLNRHYLEKRYPQYILRQRRVLFAVSAVTKCFLLIEQLNEIYVKSLLTALAHDFTLATSELYLLLTRGHSNPMTVLFGIFGMFLPLYKMFLTPIYCEKTMGEAIKCFHIIKTIDQWFPRNETIRRLVSSTITWHLENQIEFAFGVNIKLNKNLITSMAAVIFNYLLILIQFRMMEEMGDRMEATRNAISDWMQFDEFTKIKSNDNNSPANTTLFLL